MDTSTIIEQMGPLAEVAIDWVTRLVGVGIVLFVMVIVAGSVKRRIIKATQARGVDPTLSRFAANIARYALLAGTVLSCLGVFGIETTSFAAVFAAMGLAIGLALQGTLGNFAAGAMLLVFRPFKVGDVVNVAGQVGTVTELELFSTEITTGDRRRLIIPNGKIFGDTIENITHHPTRRVEVAVGIDYNADMKASRSTLLKAVASVQGIHSEPAPVAILANLGDSAVDWKVRVWCDTADFWRVTEEVTESVKRELDAANIGIPFPQMDVHLDPST